MKRYVRGKLFHQLILIVVLSGAIILLSLGVLLPRNLLPVYEKNLYNYLKQPLELVSDDIEENPISDEIVYIYMYEDMISVSDNLNSIVKHADVYRLINYFTAKYGKFYYKAHVYYYYRKNTLKQEKIRFIVFFLSFLSLCWSFLSSSFCGLHLSYVGLRDSKRKSTISTMTSMIILSMIRCRMKFTP